MGILIYLGLSGKLYFIACLNLSAFSGSCQVVEVGGVLVKVLVCIVTYKISPPFHQILKHLAKRHTFRSQHYSDSSF